MPLPVAAKAYAAGAGAALAQPVQDFVTGFCTWAGMPETVCTPLGVIVSIAVGFALAYFIPNGNGFSGAPSSMQQP